MFGAATQQLVAWLNEVCAEAEIVPEPPRGEPDSATVYAFLLEIRPHERYSDRRTALVQASLRFAVATDGLPPEEAHELLGGIYAAASTEREFHIVAGPVAPEVWIACGTAPLPCLQIEVPVRSERELEHRWVVDHPLEVQVLDREPLPARTGSATNASGRAHVNGEPDERRG